MEIQSNPSIQDTAAKAVAGSGQQCRQARTPALAAGLIDHMWTVQELLMTVVSPTAGKMKEGDYPLSLAIRIVA
jgi:hypothetical protein